MLVAVASHGTRNDRYLLQLVREYHSMSFHVDIVVLSNVPKNVASKVEVFAVDLSGKNPWSLPFPHKRIFADRLNEYDLFIYSEDDTLIREKNLRAFLDVSAVLPEDELPGFLRYEESADGKMSYPDLHAHFHWDPASVRLRGPYVMAFLTNQHSACYVLTQEQLRRAIKSGGYLADPHQERYDLLCTAATDPYTQCGLKKLVCISHLDDFLVHHLSNKYVGRWGVGDPELRRQVRALLKLGQNGQHPMSLFETETKLKGFEYSKDYYEPVKPGVLAAIPKGVRSVLSIGCGRGLTESRLAEMGLRVSAVPLDPVIPGGAEAGAVEIINGDLGNARQGLGDRKFDCLLLSNVLHLVPNPVEVLSSYASLLSERGAAIAVTPNMARLAATWKSLRGDASYAARGSYERTGVHRVSRRILRGWFCSAGMKIEKIVPLVPKSSTRVRRIASLLLQSWMADEFVVVARKLSDSQAS
jgi:2-polyprenyl-3-methyl-5-hydroxy-6-metoxy-1,4-benzoquinol methylase